MKLEDFQEYFDLHILQYLPFKDKEIYKVIFNYLLDYYFMHSYGDIPNAFKQAYEDQTIPVEFYDNLLLSNGFPSNIISTLQLPDKLILLNTFMDFNRYKGTIFAIRKVADSFNDVFNVYELYLDYRIIPNKDVLTVTEASPEWVFIPAIIYKNQHAEDELSSTFIPYDEVVKKTRYYGISKEHAEHLRQENNLLLPVKTNLLLLDYKGISQHSIVLNIYFTIILNHFKNFTTILYLKDGQYKTSFSTFYKLWYYVFFKIYGVEFGSKIGNYIAFDFDNFNFPFRLEDLHIIKSEYSKVSSRTSLSDFYIRFVQPFDEFLATEILSSSDILSNYQSDIPVSLTSYIDDRVVDIESGNILLDELYNSLITWMYSLQSTYNEYQEFLQIFVSQLPLLQVSLDKSTSYLLISHLKPYHTEIVLNDMYSSLRVNDKFNSVWIDIEELIFLNTQKSTFAQQMDTYWTNINNYQYINCTTTEYINTIINSAQKTYDDLIHNARNSLNSINRSIETISDYLNFIFKGSNFSNLPTINYNDLEILVNIIEYLSFLSYINIQINTSNNSINSISHYSLGKLWDSLKYSDLSIVIKTLQNLKHLNSSSLNIINTSLNYTYIVESTFNISDYMEPKYITNSNLTITYSSTTYDNNNPL